jgi:hypothetical protein
MEDVLAIYEKPYNPAQPVVCLDEKPISLHADVRAPIPAKPGKLAKQDNEYKRCGTANVFGVVEPKGGRHFTTATPNRCGAEFARSWTTQYTLPQIFDRLLRRAEGRGYLGSAQRALHAETRKLARSGGDRTQHVLAAMSRRAKDSGSDNAEAGNQGLEPEGQSETDQDQLAVHEKEGQEGAQVRSARPQALSTGRRA